MNNPLCAVCGHVNRAGAAVCEMCDSRLFEPAGAPAGGPEGFRPAGEEPRPGAMPTFIPSPFFRGVGDVTWPTVEVYRKHFLLVGVLVLVTMLPVALLQYASMRAVMAGAEDEGIGAAASGWSAVWMANQGLTWLLSLVGSALLSGALVYAVIELQRTGRAGAGESLRRGLKVLPKVFLIHLLYAVVVTLGYLLLIVPGIIFSLMFAVVVPVAVAENRGPVEAFSRSAELTRGYKGLIFLTYFLWGLLMIILQLIVSGSFALQGGGQDVLLSMTLLSLVSGMLESSTAVLTVYIFLGLLNESRHGFDFNTITPPAADTAGR